ncbi:Ig-like domain-containing protein [Pseudoduganella sp. LjRoot289]|uniref:RCC1 domain-containing protein n=1 Tax=Pseudoduganella sp. LjRoot289 TaxID=3342314 RepID=UPI003ED018F6
MKNTLSLKTLFMVPVLALMAACGGGGGGSTPATPTTPTATLTSITVTPANPTIFAGAKQQMLATGTYSDGKSSAITTGVTWSAKGTVAAVAADTGLVTGKGIGSDTVTATVGTVSASTGITVKGQWAGVAAGGKYNVARHQDGNLYAFGNNLYGQLGDNSTIARNQPVVVAGANTTWKQVATGGFHTLALRADGTLWAWGFNQNGQLGDGTQTNRLVPTKIGTAKWLYVAAGKSHSIGIDDKGLLWTWGRNAAGQLGDTTTIDRLAPVRAGVLTDTYTSAAAGDTHSLARRSDGALMAWGGNATGQLGTGGTVSNTAPVRVGTAVWASVAAGGGHSAAIRSDATLWTWGDNASGQLGLNTVINANAPQQVVLAGTANNWTAVSTGLGHTVAIRTDGTLWAWGANGNGQVGNDSLLNQLAPVQIGTATGWTAIAAGELHTVGMMVDNSLWTWGANTDGQLGNGQNTDQKVPVLLVQ